MNLDMSKFYNLEGQSVVVEAALDDLRPVEEGWGYAVAKVLGTLAAADVAAFIGAIFSFGILAIPGAIIGGLKGWKFINLKASEQLVSLLNKDDIKKYIIEECDKKFKELKKKNKNLTLDVDDAMKNSEKLKEVAQDNRGPVDKFFTNFGKCTTKIGNYTIMATGDSDSFDGLHVVFFDTEADKLIRESIPVPTAKTVGESMEIAEEGWVDAFGQLASMFVGGVGVGLGAAKAADQVDSTGISSVILGHLGIIAGAVGGFKLYKILSSRYFKKVIENANFKKYLEEKAEEVFKAAKKEDKTVVSKFAYIEDELKKAQDNCDDRKMKDEFIDFNKYMHDAKIDVGNFSIVAIGDSNSIKRLALVLWSEKYNKIIFRDIPVPSKQEIKEICGKKAEEAPAE